MTGYELIGAMLDARNEMERRWMHNLLALAALMASVFVSPFVGDAAALTLDGLALAVYIFTAVQWVRAHRRVKRLLKIHKLEGGK